MIYMSKRAGSSPAGTMAGLFGTGAFVQYPDSTFSESNTTSLTFEAIIRTNGTIGSSGRAYLWSHEASTRSWHSAYLYNTSGGVRVDNTGYNTNPVTSTRNVTVNGFTHIALVKKLISPGNFSGWLFIDGVQALVWSGGFATFSITNPLYVGNSGRAGSEFRGHIKEFALYSSNIYPDGASTGTQIFSPPSTLNLNDSNPNWNQLLRGIDFTTGNVVDVKGNSLVNNGVVCQEV